MAKRENIAVFADSGVTAHQPHYRKAGTAIAKQSLHLICIAHHGEWPRALVDSALALGGKVTIVSGTPVKPHGVPQGVEVITAASDDAAAQHAVEMSDAIIGLPGGIDVVGSLYKAWAAAGGAQAKRPVGLLNQGRAYEVVKGFAHDVAAVGRGNIDPLFQTSDTIEDLLNRIMRLA